jgi:hypothetical protein
MRVLDKRLLWGSEKCMQREQSRASSGISRASRAVSPVSTPAMGVRHSYPRFQPGYASTRGIQHPLHNTGLKGRYVVAGMRSFSRRNRADHPVEKSCLRRAHSVPLVLGTSPIEGSIATAARSARANALNAASQMWWSFLPVTVMWAVIPAWLQRL